MKFIKNWWFAEPLRDSPVSGSRWILFHDVVVVIVIVCPCRIPLPTSYSFSFCCSRYAFLLTMPIRCFHIFPLSSFCRIWLLSMPRNPRGFLIRIMAFLQPARVCFVYDIHELTCSASLCREFSCVNSDKEQDFIVKFWTFEGVHEMCKRRCPHEISSAWNSMIPI